MKKSETNPAKCPFFGHGMTNKLLTASCKKPEAAGEQASRHSVAPAGFSRVATFQHRMFEASPEGNARFWTRMEIA
jgi:hypothetical protein